MDNPENLVVTAIIPTIIVSLDSDQTSLTPPKSANPVYMIGSLSRQPYSKDYVLLAFFEAFIGDKPEQICLKHGDCHQPLEDDEDSDFSAAQGLAQYVHTAASHTGNDLSSIGGKT